MIDHIEIGSSPNDESCAQLGTPDFTRRARAECNALIRQLRRMFGEEPAGVRLKIKSCMHDFGSYYEVACYFDDHDSDAVAYAFRCERESPAQWDSEAIEELALSL